MRLFARFDAPRREELAVYAGLRLCGKKRQLGGAWIKADMASTLSTSICYGLHSRRHGENEKRECVDAEKSPRP